MLHLEDYKDYIYETSHGHTAYMSGHVDMGLIPGPHISHGQLCQVSLERQLQNNKVIIRGHDYQYSLNKFFINFCIATFLPYGPK